MEKSCIDNGRTNNYHDFLTRDNEAEGSTVELDSDEIFTEKSIFLSAERGVADMASWSGQPTIKGSTEAMRMALLTFSLAGLQYVVENSWKRFTN